MRARKEPGVVPEVIGIMSMLMRKYKKEILWVTIILVVGPFVIWGGYRSANRPDPDLESALAPVAVVEGASIPAAEFREALNQELQQRKRFGQEAEFTDLLADGSAQRVMEAMVSRRLLATEAENSPYSFDKAYLVEQLKEQFKNDAGQFDAEQFNEWVKLIDERSGQSWNQIYEEVANQMRYQLVITEAAASARVSEKELKTQFEDAHTKLDLKYVAIAPPIEPTEEDIRAQYDADPSVYDIPAKRKADFVALSVRPPAPAVAAEIIQKARAGEDFAELAKAHSEGVDAAEGGDMGWMVKTPQTPAFQEPLFALKPGEVSDVVEGPAGQYFIYKAEEDREGSSLPGVRDVKARRIVLSPKLSPEENAALTAKAEALLAAARESGDLAAAAAEAGLQVQTTDLFGPDSVAIAQVPQEDVFRFRTGVSELGQGVFSNVIPGQANLYVAKVVELTPPEPQPFEAVKDQVREDAIEAVRRSPEYIERCRALAEEIKGSVSVLAEPALLHGRGQSAGRRLWSHTGFHGADVSRAVCGQASPHGRGLGGEVASGARPVARPGSVHGAESAALGLPAIPAGYPPVGAGRRDVPEHLPAIPGRNRNARGRSSRARGRGRRGRGRRGRRGSARPRGRRRPGGVRRQPALDRREPRYRREEV